MLGILTEDNGHNLHVTELFGGSSLTSGAMQQKVVAKYSVSKAYSSNSFL